MSQPQPAPTIVQVCTDVKPRLTKDQHEILEQHFRQQPKPSTSIKKGFADALGVPLDKINNWFQNRRAKVKQDAKKLNSMRMFPINMPHQQPYVPHPMQMSQLPIYHGIPPVVPSNTESVNEPVLAQSTIAVQNPNMMQTSMPAANFMQAPGMTSAPQGLPFEASAFSTSISGPPMLLQDFNFDTSFEDDFMAMPESQELFMPEARVPVSMAQLQTNAMLTPPTDNVSPNTMPQLTSAYIHQSQCEEEKLRFQVDSPQDVTDFSSSTGHPTPADSTTTWSSVAPGPEIYEQPNVSAPVLMQSQESPASIDSYDRRDSPAIAESVNSAVFDTSASESESSFKAPSQFGGLAARRQKPRPANLMPTAFRSASYSAGMPGSPGAAANPNTQDQLRRIRSGGVGMVNGRISKPSGAQKSPMHANFDAAAYASPKFARHASNFSVSTINSSGPLTATTMPGSLAPPTPITPGEFNGFPIGQAPGFGFHNGSPSAFSHMGEDAIYLDTSSPMHKLDMQQMEQFRANQMARDNASLFHTPPQSAPPTQQHFAFPQPGMPPRMLQPPTSHGMGHVRRISLPENHGQEFNGHFQQPQMMQPGQGMQPPFNPQLAEAFNAEPNAFHMGQAMPMPAQCGGEMGMQMMVPQQIRIPVDSQLPVHFHNQTPEDFQNTIRAK